ncbi:MAG: hypothetical protein CBB71_03725 [Rhodopirellula sp. TMED11]|nr:MAG: hypothetical protein CBB71_03725 [Rhodopirellula sp. TMED11]
MLVLSRKVGQKLLIGDDVVMTVHKINGNRAVLMIDAPKQMSIQRAEVSVESAQPKLNQPQSVSIGEFSV